jgi:hypothetical protein
VIFIFASFRLFVRVVAAALVAAVAAPVRRCELQQIMAIMTSFYIY